MAAPTVTNTFTNGTTADATAVNQNFSDIISAFTDGTSDLTYNDLTVNGAAVLNGTVTLGNATGDDIVFNGYIASTAIPKTNATYALGSSSLCWSSIYLDNSATDGGAIYFDAGTTYFLKATAAGTTLDVGGFTSLDLNTTCDVVGGLHYYAAVNNATIYDEGDPVYSFSGDTDTGMYSEAANQLNFATGGVAALSIDSSQNLSVLAGHVYAPVNTGTIYDEGDPPYSFTGDTDTGMYSEGANQLNLATGGVAALSIDSSQLVTIPASLTVSTDITLSGAIKTPASRFVYGVYPGTTAFTVLTVNTDNTSGFCRVRFTVSRNTASLQGAQSFEILTYWWSTSKGAVDVTSVNAIGTSTGTPAGSWSSNNFQLAFSSAMAGGAYFYEILAYYNGGTAPTFA